MITLRQITQAIILYVRPDDYRSYGVEYRHAVFSTFFYELQKTARSYLPNYNPQPEDYSLVLFGKTFGKGLERIVQAYASHYMAFNIWGCYPVSSDFDSILMGIRLFLVDMIWTPLPGTMVMNSSKGRGDDVADWTEAERSFLKSCGQLLRTSLTPAPHWCIAHHADNISSRS